MTKLLHLIIIPMRRAMAPVLPLMLAGCCLVLGLPATADAAMMMTRKRAMIRLGSFAQSISVSAEFSNSSSDTDGGSSSSSTSSFQENYSLSFPFLIYDPRIVKGTFRTVLGLNQNFTSPSTGEKRKEGSERLQYRLQGVLLQKKPYPISFHSFSEVNQARSAFGPTTTIVSSGQGVNLSIRNSYLPASITYARSSTESEGFSKTSSNGESYSLGVSHSFGISSTSLNYAHSEQESRGSNGTIANETTSLRVANTLRKDWGHRKAQLFSRYDETITTGDLPRKERELSADLELVLGRALRGGGQYRRLWDDTESQKTRSEYASIYLSHTLLKSLMTGVSLNWNKEEFLEGESTGSGMAVSLAYRKQLAGDRIFTLGYNFSNSTSEQSVPGGIITVASEPHTIPGDHPFPLYEFPLARNDVIYEGTTDIVVTDSTRIHTYQEGVDYAVRQEGNVTYISLAVELGATPPLYAITPGSQVLVSYRHNVNNSSSYESTAHGVTAGLTVGGGRLVLNGGASRTTTSSETPSDRLGKADSVSNYYLGASTRRDKHNFGGNWRRTVMERSTTDSYAIYWNFSNIYRFARVSTTVQERYSRSTSSYGDATWSNTFTARSQLSRTILRRVAMKVTGMYTNRLDMNDMNHQVFLELNLDSSIGRSNVGLSLSNNWEKDSLGSTRNTILNAYFRRRF